MTWIGVRRWVGRHPTIILGIANGLGTVPLTWGLCSGPSVVPSWEPAYMKYLRYISLASPRAMIVVTCLVGLIRGRAGLPILDERYKVLGVAVLVQVLAQAASGILGCGPLPLVVSAGCIMAGLSLAESITQRRIASGKWEVTTPVEPPKGQP